jgi:hypothetical protein
MLKLILAFSLALVTWSAPANRTAPLAPTTPVTDESPVKVTLAQLLQDPAVYNHKLVEVTGFVSQGFEDFTIFDPSYPDRYAVWLEYGGTAASGTMYCCGPTNARTRPAQLTVEEIAIPLVDDALFRKFDELVHQPPDTTVHAPLVGRFFSGKKTTYQGGDSWGGYGHMGCCSLLVIQQVVAVDPHDRDDLDYRASADQPDANGVGCSIEYMTDDILSDSIKAQQSAEQGQREWALTDPQRVAAEALERVLHRNAGSITGLRQTRTAQGRFVYEWRQPGRRGFYMINVSRPYWLSFYAKDSKRVIWVTTAIDKASCG